MIIFSACSYILRATQLHIQRFVFWTTSSNTSLCQLLSNGSQICHKVDMQSLWKKYYEKNSRVFSCFCYVFGQVSQFLRSTLFNITYFRLQWSFTTLNGFSAGKYMRLCTYVFPTAYNIQRFFIVLRTRS